MRRRSFIRRLGTPVAIASAVGLSGCFGQNKLDTVTADFNMGYRGFEYSINVSTRLEDGETRSASVMAESSQTITWDSDDQPIPERISIVSQKQGSSGKLELLLKADGEVKSSSVTTQPYGVVRASRSF